MGTIQLKVQELNAMKPNEVLENQTVKDRFIEKYNQIHGSEAGEMFYESEKYNFQKALSNSKDLPKCTGFSIYGVFMDIASMGMTITTQSKPLLYLLTRNVKVKEGPPEVWEKRAYIDVSPYGELALRVQAGQILYVDRPVVVYEGDTFQPGMNEFGNKYVKYEPAVPRKSTKIIGSFISLTRPDNSKDFYWMLEEEIQRLKKASNRQNKGTATESKANALYTSNEGQIDIGFLEAKTLKHSLMVFPKIRIGQFTTLQTFDDEPKPGEYGLSAADEVALKKAKTDITAYGDENQAGIPEEPTVQVTDENEIF